MLLIYLFTIFVITSNQQFINSKLEPSHQTDINDKSEFQNSSSSDIIPDHRGHRLYNDQ